MCILFPSRESNGYTHLKNRFIMENAYPNASQVQTVLRYTYGLVPIVAGLDKFTHLLTDWTAYVGQNIQGMLPVAVGTWMMVVGVIEMAAGALTLARPRIGALVVAGWLVVVALVLVSGGRYFDVAVRDLVMAVGAYALARLS